MDFFKEKLSGLSKKERFMLGGIAAIFIIVLIFLTLVYLSSNKKVELTDYDYNTIEQQIADNVKEYISLFIELSKNVSAQIADEAVKNYNIILTSVGTDAVKDEHTEIIKQRIRETIFALIGNGDTEGLTEDELDSLAAGITEIIWNAVLSQIEEVVVTNNYEQEYTYLTESIQKQIDELAEQKMRITISASITDNEDEISDDIDAESLLAAINEMTDDDLQKLAAALGLSPEELQRLLNANNLALNKELEEKLAGLKKEISDELLLKYNNTVRTQNGSPGKNGTNGKNGKDGKDGEDGRDGSNGKTTYIAYADDMNGAGFSLTPTESSKYVGTCITDADMQPTDYKSYSNWQIYRTYIITTTTDENGITTVHIN